jgi:hypothetical protein
MPEHNSRGFHHGDRIDKGIQRGVHDLNSVPCHEMGPGILGAPLNTDPHGGGPQMPVHIAPGTLPEHRPPGLLRDNGPLNPAPHVYGGDPKAPNTYGNVPVEKWR